MYHGISEMSTEELRECFAGTPSASDGEENTLSICYSTVEVLLHFLKVYYVALTCVDRGLCHGLITHP
jgi:hypothetical protein